MVLFYDLYIDLKACSARNHALKQALCRLQYGLAPMELHSLPQLMSCKFSMIYV